MQPEVRVWLYDILNAILEIESFFEDTPMDFVKYSRDLKTKRAVERNLEILGEAMNRILKLDDRFQLSNSRKIVDFRNRIIHGYDSISDDVVWGIIIRHLPILKKEVQALLKE